CAAPDELGTAAGEHHASRHLHAGGAAAVLDPGEVDHEHTVQAVGVREPPAVIAGLAEGVAAAEAELDGSQDRGVRRVHHAHDRARYVPEAQRATVGAHPHAIAEVGN